MKNLLLIDGFSIINRAFYGVPPLTNYQGLPTNAVFGFINIMLKALEEESADYIQVAFDLKAPTFRHKIFDGYKGTRKPMPEELHQQVPLVKEALKAMGIPFVSLEGYEADDIIGTIAKNSQAEGFHVSILSGDRDLLQLADENIKIRLPKTSKGKTMIETYYPKDVFEKYGVTPIEFIDLKALMGDTSDNIPGVPGIGEKTATAIIEKFTSIEEAYNHIDEIKPPRAKKNLEEFYEQAVLSKVLATIDTKVPITYDIENAHIEDLFTQEAYELFSRLELKALLKKFDKSITNPINNELKFDYIQDFSSAEETFNKCNKFSRIGVAIAHDAEVLYGVAISYDQTNVFISCCGFISEEYLKNKLIELGKNCNISTINLKNQLDYLATDIQTNIDDLAIIGYLINALKSNYFYNDIAQEYLGISYQSKSEIMEKKSIKKISETEPELLMKIYCMESNVALQAFHDMYNKLLELKMENVYKVIELPIIFVLRSMEIQGIEINQKALKEYGDELQEKISELEIRIHKAAGEDFNINSPKQLGEILFVKMQLPSGKKTKTGYSTSADVLEKLAVEFPFVNDILEYRTLSKLKSTYADGLADYIESDHRIHGTFNQTITATGRLSSTEPNLQNIPIRMEIGRKIRKVFIPKKDYIFIDSDYSQIELRLLAHMSGDDTLIEAYNEDSDIHRITASKVFHTPLEEVTGTQRSNAKAVNFGIIYGISSFGLSRDLGITTKQAKKYIEDYFETYPSIKKYLNELVENAKNNGYAETILGRKRPIPELSSSNFMQRQFGERIAMNSPLQGTAADIIKIAMIRVYKKLKEKNLKSQLILQIHDELLIETAPNEEEIVREILQQEMCNAAELKVPLVIDTHKGYNWFEAK